MLDLAFHLQMVDAWIQIDFDEIHSVVAPVFFIESAVHENRCLFRSDSRRESQGSA